MQAILVISVDTFIAKQHKHNSCKYRLFSTPAKYLPKSTEMISETKMSFYKFIIYDYVFVTMTGIYEC